MHIYRQTSNYASHTPSDIAPLTLRLPPSWLLAIGSLLAFLAFIMLIPHCVQVEVRCSHAEGACIVAEATIFGSPDERRYPLETLTGTDVVQHRTQVSTDEGSEESITYSVRFLTQNGPVLVLWDNNNYENTKVLAECLDHFIKSGAPDPLVASANNFGLLWATGGLALLLALLFLNSGGRVILDRAANRLTIHRARWVGAGPIALSLDAVCGVETRELVSGSDEESTRWAMIVRMSGGAELEVALPSVRPSGFTLEINRVLTMIRTPAIAQ